MIVMASAKVHRGGEERARAASMEELDWGSVFSQGVEEGLLAMQQG